MLHFMVILFKIYVYLVDHEVTPLIRIWNVKKYLCNSDVGTSIQSSEEQEQLFVSRLSAIKSVKCVVLSLQMSVFKL